MLHMTALDACDALRTMTTASRRIHMSHHINPPAQAQMPAYCDANMQDVEFEQLVADVWGTNVKMEVLMRIFGLDRCRDTLVGGPMLRGISGGEKKRLTSAEQLVGPKVVCSSCSPLALAMGGCIFVCIAHLTCCSAKGAGRHVLHAVQTCAHAAVIPRHAQYCLPAATLDRLRLHVRAAVSASPVLAAVAATTATSIADLHCMPSISRFAAVAPTALCDGMQRVLLMDEISTGLDSATTYTVASFLARATRMLQLTTVVSLLQPPPEVFHLFDDCLLLTDG